jgi:hypothetical protein
VTVPVRGERGSGAASSANAGAAPATVSGESRSLSATEANASGRWEAEIHRLSGELLLASSRGAPSDSEARLYQAIEVARRKSAKSPELRAAASLARLLACCGTTRFPAEQARIVQLLVERVAVQEAALEVRIRAEGLSSLVAELRQCDERRAA